MTIQTKRGKNSEYRRTHNDALYTFERSLGFSEYDPSL